MAVPTELAPSAITELLAAAAQRAPVHETPDGGTALIVPVGYKVQQFGPLEPILPRIRQSVTMHDVTSFVAYVNRFKGPATQIFAEPGFISGDKPSLTAALDYHAPGQPDHVAHVASYQPRYSEQWMRWKDASARPMRQSDFAEFVEEVRSDITAPSAASLLDIVRAFKASKKIEFDSVTYQANGDVRLTYDERTEQKGSSGVLPEQMKIGIPVYFRGPPYEVDVFVRYKVANAAVMFSLKIDRADVVEDAAFAEITAIVASETGVTPYLGRR
jgi:uncharacterized protein YfdQ (DUF2303 family)